jgi:putative transposase
VRREWIGEQSDLSIKRRCELLGMSRSGVYYVPATESDENLAMMAWMDREHLEKPFYGVRRMREGLRRAGHQVNLKRVRRLMGQMRIEVQYPKRNLSYPGQDPWVYPYLLEGLEIDRPHQVWAIDITYIPMPSGSAYLVAIIDWYSRYVLAWQLSNSLEASFCMECLEKAIEYAQQVPGIFNSDQGSQFTSKRWIETLELLGVQVSHDGVKRAIHNIMIERVWRSLKYEDVYPKRYSTMKEAHHGIGSYFDLYNKRRWHQTFDYKTPEEVLMGK